MRNIKESKNVKTLLLKLRKNGLTYTQVLRGHRSALYELMVSESEKRYEVFKIRIKPKRKINGMILEAREKFPGNEDFGYTAWVYGTLDEAKRKFNEIEKEAKEL